MVRFNCLVLLSWHVTLVVYLLHVSKVCAIDGLSPDRLNGYPTSVEHQPILHPPSILPTPKTPNRLRRRVYTSQHSDTGNATYTLVAHKVVHFISSQDSTLMIARVTTALERIYDFMAFFLVDLDVLEEHDLTLRIGGFELEVHCVADILSVLAIKAILRKLVQMGFEGLTGLVVGEVVDVTTAVRTVFAFGLALRFGGEGWLLGDGDDAVGHK